MNVVCKNTPFNHPYCAATIGSFDGVHRGHRYIIERVHHLARQAKIKSLVITFDYHPQFILAKNGSRKKMPFPGCITTNQEKIELIKNSGIDFLWLLKSCDKLFNLTGYAFLKYICRIFNIRILVVGDDFRFGSGSGIDVKGLKVLAKEFDFKIKTVCRKKIHNRVISSSLIRELILSAQFAQIKKLLGRPYTLTGIVQRGRGIGAVIGFPTVNILAKGHVIPGKGVYAALVTIDGKNYISAVNIGNAPTLKQEKEIIIEAHLLDIREDFRGKTIRIEFFKKIRDEKRFKSRKILISAITCDIISIRAYFMKRGIVKHYVAGIAKERGLHDR